MIAPLKSETHESAEQADITRLTQHAGELGFDVVAAAGYLEDLNSATQAQMRPITDAHIALEELGAATRDIRAMMDQMVQSVQDARDASVTSATRIRDNFENSRRVAEWVRTLDHRMSQISTTLGTMQTAVSGIGGIALQVKILAINAKIEAARAGAAGRGFSVVADEINTLSQKTSDATEGIHAAIAGLATGIHDLRDEATTISTVAAAAIDETVLVDNSLSDIQSAIENNFAAARTVETATRSVQLAHNRCAPAVEAVMEGAQQTAGKLVEAKERSLRLIGLSESVYRDCILLGGTSEDGAMIDLAQHTAEKIGVAFSNSIRRGDITAGALFNADYKPIANSNPLQHLAAFTALTDKILPPIQEPVLRTDDRIVFCAAVDRNGYLPTHNEAFSKPQGRDPVWNSANSRNRRIFNDRVGLGAGRNTAPFLIQLYRRDMGGGNFVLMKDISAPIFVDGKHWGGLRLAYKV